MIRFFAGVIVGIILTTVGFSGISRIMDNGISKVQDISKEAAK